MRGLPLLLLALVATGCAHDRAGREDIDDIEEVVGADETLDALDEAFLALRDVRAPGAHDDAREWLEIAVPAFEDLALDATPLEKAFASDATKPYRGRPHERVLASVVLAALDIERGRCDLALPTLRNAAFLDVRHDPREASDAVLVHVLALRCLKQAGAARGDVDRARKDLASALAMVGSPERAFELEALALAPDLELALDGDGPGVRSDGAMGERTIVTPSMSPAPSTVSPARVPEGAARIRLGSAPAASSEGLTVWSSTHQATTVQGRPFDEVLKNRAVLREQSLREGTRLIGDGVQRVRSAPRLDGRTVVASALVATAGAGIAALGAATDARADVRVVTSLFERAVLLGSLPLAWTRTSGSPSPSHACLAPLLPLVRDPRVPLAPVVRDDATAAARAPRRASACEGRRSSGAVPPVLDP